MSLQSLPADCVLLVISYLSQTEIQELALTTKCIRSKCLISSYARPLTMLLSKTMYPEIILKIATTLEVTEIIEKTGSNWLKSVLKHFNRIHTIQVTVKRLNRHMIKAIWNDIKENDSIKTLKVPNNELRSWCKTIQNKSSNIKIRPLYRKNFKKDAIGMGECASDEAIKSLNEYMISAAARYEAGEKLNNPYEALALSNIFVIDENNNYNINLNDRTVFKKRSNISNDFELAGQEEKDRMTSIINDYSSNALKDSNNLLNILSKYKDETSKSVKLCLEILKNVDSVMSKSWDTDATTNEEDIFISSVVDTIITNPTFKDMSTDLKKHGNKQSLKESRHRKIRQAKKIGDSLKGWKGRIPGRSLELQVNKKLSYHVFLCEVKTASSSKKHPDLVKLGTMLKDLLDFALENGVSSDYSVSGILIEGPACTVFSLSEPIPKLYQMEQIHSFDLPMKLSELKKVITVVDSIIICQHLINTSCHQLKAIDNTAIIKQQYSVPTYQSPSNYTDYYT